MFVNPVKINSNNNIQIKPRQSVLFASNNNMLGFDPEDLFVKKPDLNLTTRQDGFIDLNRAGKRFNLKTPEEQAKLLECIDNFDIRIKHLEPKDQLANIRKGIEKLPDKIRNNFILDVISVLDADISAKKTAINLLGAISKGNKFITNVLLTVLNDHVTFEPDKGMTNYIDGSGEAALKALAISDPEIVEKLFKDISYERVADKILSTELFLPHYNYPQIIDQSLKIASDPFIDKNKLILSIKEKDILAKQLLFFKENMNPEAQAKTLTHNCKRFCYSPGKEMLSKIIVNCLRK